MTIQVGDYVSLTRGAQKYVQLCESGYFEEVKNKGFIGIVVQKHNSYFENGIMEYEIKVLPVERIITFLERDILPIPFNKLPKKVKMRKELLRRMRITKNKKKKLEYRDQIAKLGRGWE